MNTIHILGLRKPTRLLLGALLAAGAVACSDSNDWQPGEDYHTVNQVIITSASPATLQLSPGESTSVDLTFERQNPEGAISVPLVAKADKEFAVPSTVEFADGEKEVTVPITFTHTEGSGTYYCDLIIEAGAYNSTYSSDKTQERIKIEVYNWLPFASNVQFTPDRVLPAFTADMLKAEGKDVYRIVDFTVGQDLTFEAPLAPASDGYAEGVRYIRPIGGSYGADPFDWGYQVWYFCPTITEDNYIIKWHGWEDYNLDYCFIFVNLGMVSWFMPDSQMGCINIDYSRYDLSGNYIDGSYDYINFNWTNE